MRIAIFSKGLNGLQQVEDIDCDEWTITPNGELVVSRDGRPLVAFAPGQWDRVQEAAE